MEHRAIKRRKSMREPKITFTELTKEVERLMSAKKIAKVDLSQCADLIAPTINKLATKERKQNVPSKSSH